MSFASPLSSFRLRRLAGSAAIRLGAVATLAAAAVATMTMVQEPADAEPVPDLLVSLDDWNAGGAGKIGIRHRDAAIEPGRTGAYPVRPVAHAMPMTIAWQAPQPAVARTAAEVSVETSRRQLAAAVRPLPQARPASAQPIVLAAQNAPSAPVGDEAGFLPAVVTVPLVRAGSLVKGAVTGAAGGVVTAGSWTLSQASNLLPRW